jgi:hypothetical protein
VDCGSETVTWTRQTYAHRFIPWVYMFVRAESIEAYSNMFKVIIERAHQFFDIRVSVAFASLDHSEAIASAFLQEWPQVKLLTCWPHLMRQARKKRTILADAEAFDTQVKPDLRVLRSARSHEQFVKIASIITDNWTALGHGEYANWFREIYLVDRWSRWHINGAGVAGVIPSQQGIEAHHGAIKKTCAPSTRASTFGVMDGIIPRILRADGELLCPAMVAHFGEGPVPPEMLIKAQRLVENNNNFRRVHKGSGRQRRLVAVLFNSSKYIVDGVNSIGSPVTQTRARRYIMSLGGRVASSLSAAEVQFELLSLHRVVIDREMPTGQFTLSPIWSSSSIRRLRRFLQCACETFIRTGWVCSHTLATLSLLSLLDLAAALSRVPVRNTPGRPPTRRHALVVDDDRDGYYSINRLIKLFIGRPGQPLQWKVVDTFDITADGAQEQSNFIGTVVSVRMSNGVYLWSVQFEDGDTRDYDAAELAGAVRRAHCLGVSITG